MDITVQEGVYPTDAKLINKARERLVKEAGREAIKLRQSYKFLGKRESAQAARYFHAKQFRRGKVSIRPAKDLFGSCSS